jgi:alkylhydroperoxidase/carboxymuconolactone decarboxylase family protein YurZ
MSSTNRADAWVQLPDAKSLAPLFENHPYNFGFVAAMGRLIAAHDSIGPSFAALFNQILFAKGALSRAEREMVAAVAAAAQDCHY